MLSKIYHRYFFSLLSLSFYSLSLPAPLRPCRRRCPSGNAPIGNGSGGGGGGIVHMLAPIISQGTVSVSGGLPGGNVTNDDTSSSGCGGALGGDGGRGLYDVGDTGWAAEAGGDGYVITTTVASPENLFY